MKLDCIYRACDRESNPDSIYKNSTRPDWFDWRGKYKCFKNFFDNFNTENIYVIWDGEENGLAAYIRSFPIKSFIQIDAGSDRNSLLYCYKFADQLKSDYYYFIEDDFLHTNNSLKILKEGLGLSLVVSLYDHFDRYKFASKDITYGQEYIFITPSCHWRSAESTTNTCAMKQSFFNRYREKLMGFAPNDREFYRAIIPEGHRLFTPMPGCATHVNKDCLTPFVDWKKLYNNITL